MMVQVLIQCKETVIGLTYKIFSESFHDVIKILIIQGVNIMCRVCPCVSIKE